MEKNKYTGTRRLFLDEFYLKSRELKKRIKKTIAKKIRQFPEAADIDTICANCIDAIEKKLIAQFDAKPDEHFNNKEKNRKLTLFKEDKAYVQKYILEATKTFCRKKQNYWGHGRNEGDVDKGETHKAKKVGRAARVHLSRHTNEADGWMDTLTSSNFSSDMLPIELIDNLNQFFKNRGLNDKKIECFWDRVAGLTFSEMARQSDNPTASSDKYRKRFKRLMDQLEPNIDEFIEILLGRYN